MFRSIGFRFLVVGFLTVLMSIPLTMVGGVIDDRADYSRATVASVGAEWGGEQLISGPLLVIPVEEEVTTRKRREAVDPETGQPRRDANNNLTHEYYDETEFEKRPPVYIYPDAFDMTIAASIEERYRGIFQVPVYRAEAKAGFEFPAALAQQALAGRERLVWDKAEVRIFLSDNRGLRGEAVLGAGDREFRLEPIPASSDTVGGIFAAVGDPRAAGPFQLVLNLNGAQSILATPAGRDSRVTITSPWPHPSFFGAFLPDTSTISDQGFSASWSIPHLARALAQVSRLQSDATIRQDAAFGVRFFQPNDFYQKAYRAARYGILFVALTFLAVLLLDRTAPRPTHPVQYILIGLAQSVFVLLMAAYAEQIGFGPAYALSAGATVALLTMYGGMALKLGRRTWVLGGLLTALYAVLYLILKSADFALLAGSTLAFLALAGTMFLTRNEDWGAGMDTLIRAAGGGKPMPPGTGTGGGGDGSAPG